jgi:hypothetical protein
VQGTSLACCLKIMAMHFNRKLGEVNVFNASLDAFEKLWSASTHEFCHQLIRAQHTLNNLECFFSGQNCCRQSLGSLRPHGVNCTFRRFVECFSIKEQQGTECPILDRARHLLFDGKIGQKPLNFSTPNLVRMTLLWKRM